MIDAYEIGVELQLDDQIIPALAQVDAALAQLQVSADKVSQVFAGWPSSIGNATAAVKQLTSALGDAASAAGRIVIPAAPAGGGYTPGAAAPAPAMPLPMTPSPQQPGAAPPPVPQPYPELGPAYQAPNLPAVMPGASTRQSGPERWSATPIRGYGTGGTPAGGDSGGGGGAAPPNFTTGEDEPFDPNPAPVRPTLDPSKPEGGLGLGLSDLFFGQAALDMGGRVVAAGYGTIAKPGDQLTRMRLLDQRLSQGDLSRAMDAAKQIVRDVPGMSLTGALQIIAGSYQQTRGQGRTAQQSLDEALALAMPLAKDAAVLQGYGKTDAENQIFDLQRAAEAAGLLNDKNPDGSVNTTRFTNFVNNATRVSVSVPGVDPHQILLQTQQNDVGAMSADAQGQTLDEIVASALGGYKSGTGLAALSREFTGGKMSTGTEHILEKLGLIDPRGATKNGQYYTLAAGALRDQDLFNRDPVKWIETVFMGAVQKMSPDDYAAMLHDIYSGTGTTAGARVAGDAVLQSAYIARQQYDADNLVPGVDRSLDIISQNPTTAASSAGNAVNNAINTVLNPSTPIIVSAENRVSKAVDTVAQNTPLTDADTLGLGAAIAGLGLKFFSKAPLAAALSEGFGEVLGGPVGWALLATNIAAIIAGDGPEQTLGGPLPGNFRGRARFGGQDGPTGHKNDPVHVTFDSGLRSWVDSWLPAGTTGPNPALSPPQPGQTTGHN